LIAAHGVDMKKAIDYYHGMIEGNSSGTDVQTVSGNKNEESKGFGRMQVDHEMISSQSV
jgi:hypothetical protein